MISLFKQEGLSEKGEHGEIFRASKEYGLFEGNLGAVTLFFSQIKFIIFESSIIYFLWKRKFCPFALNTLRTVRTSKSPKAWASYSQCLLISNNENTLFANDCLQSINARS